MLAKVAYTEVGDKGNMSTTYICDWTVENIFNVTVRVQMNKGIVNDRINPKSAELVILRRLKKDTL